MANSRRSSKLWGGLFGLILGILAVGSPAGSGALINLDLIAVGDLGIPDSLVALGPEIPRRAPLQAFWALMSPPLSAAEVTRIWMILIVAGAAAGIVVYLEGLRLPIRWGAAVAYSLSPFLLTRLSVGHLGLATATALLPWAVGSLGRPFHNGRQTLLWLAAFALCGYFGALVAGPLVFGGLISERQLPTLRQAAAGVATQTPWLTPALVSLRDARGAAGAAGFESHIANLADALRLPLGFGFWRNSNQLGTEHAWTVLASLLLALVAWVGLRWGLDRHNRLLVGLGSFGLLMTVASAIPGISGIYDALTSVVLLGPLREGQRLLLFTVFAFIVFAARGLDRLLQGRPSPAQVGAGCLLGALMVAVSGGALWGLGGSMEDHSVPASWEQAAEIVGGQSGLTLALPWNQYFDIEIADGRRGHHPVPLLVGGDVLFRHDLGLGGANQVSRDDREHEAAALLRGLRFGEPIDLRMAGLGVTWIVALPQPDTPDIELLRSSSAVSTVLDTPEISVFRGAGGAPRSLTSWNVLATAILLIDIAWMLGVFSLLFMQGGVPKEARIANRA